MKLRVRYVRIGFSGLVALLVALCASAQPSVLGKGWLLDSAGSVTSAASEVISGRGSIKGSYSGSNSFTPFLYTQPTFIRFAPNQTYTVTFNYRIVTVGSGTFDLAFNSPTANSVGSFGPGTVIRGAAGASGTATFTAGLQNHTDYHFGLGIAGTGAIVVDDIRIADSSGRVIASENAEGPTLASGPLPLRVTDAITLQTPANSFIVSAAVKDLDGDGYAEAVVALTAPPPSNTPIEPIIVESSRRLRLATSDFFPEGAPTLKDPPLVLFADINGDGLPDILFAEAGYDMAPQQPGSAIGVALNLGGGKYRNVSALIPPDLQTGRSYALAAGDLTGEGRALILLPDEDNGANTALLRWNGNGFDALRNWIAPSLWTEPTKLVHNDSLAINDFDGDGHQDLLVGAAPIPGIPNLRLLFGSAGGFRAADLITLPDGQFGHATTSDVPVVQTADVTLLVVADLNSDGRPDIFAFQERVLGYRPGTITDPDELNYADLLAHGGIVFAEAGIQVLRNQGGRSFVDVTSSSTAPNLGRRHYFSAMAVDMNNDGFLDVVGWYVTAAYGAEPGGEFGTTVFLNDGTGAFQAVDGAQLFGVTTTPSDGRRWNLGAMLPTLVTRERTEGVAIESVGRCGIGLCTAARLNLYRVVADRAIGTGPNFADPAPLGAPGYNEFFYLRHHADAAAAVQSGKYANGLEHFLAVGRDEGYSPAFGTPTKLRASSSGSTVTLDWAAPADARVARYVLEAGSAPGLSDIASVSIGTATTFSAVGVADGLYYVRLRSVVGTATSAPSNEVPVSVGSCTSAPQSPSGLSAEVVGSAVTLHWTASRGAPQTYVLDAGSAPGRTDIVSASLGIAATTFSAPSVAPGTYYGRIRAVNACGSSGPTNEIMVTVKATPG